MKKTILIVVLGALGAAALIFSMTREPDGSTALSGLCDETLR